MEIPARITFYLIAVSLTGCTAAQRYDLDLYTRKYQCSISEVHRAWPSGAYGYWAAKDVCRAPLIRETFWRGVKPSDLPANGKAQNSSPRDAELKQRQELEARDMAMEWEIRDKVMDRYYPDMLKPEAALAHQRRMIEAQNRNRPDSWWENLFYDDSLERSWAPNILPLEPEKMGFFQLQKSWLVVDGEIFRSGPIGKDRMLRLLRYQHRLEAKMGRQHIRVPWEELKETRRTANAR